MGFSPRTDALLDRASIICSDRGARLTTLRRQVLGLILDAPQPVGVEGDGGEHGFSGGFGHGCYLDPSGARGKGMDGWLPAQIPH